MYGCNFQLRPTLDTITLNDLPLDQMIQWTKQEHDIEARVRTLQIAGVTDLYACEGASGCA